ncbi:polymeric immunoglobulin receptor-like [Misgurnus anguillicaudatus]|uniref:polymeric immunoglobulin receptor-like n=1 Tax=Misgurnus anguillicaudatus TaxID=75329 RepID=UPI003CCFB570
MKILLILSFFIISGAVRCFDVIGYSGGSVLVNSLKPWHKNSAKYMHEHQQWNMIINQEKHDPWINEGRFTLFCNIDGNLMIYIRDLNTEDFGTYRIGVDGQWYNDISLDIKENSCCGASQTVMVNTGETANFRCQYSQDYKTDNKIIFKEEKESIVNIYSTYRHEKKERFSISDDREKNLFSVRITDVRSEDAGVYLCGVWLYRNSYSYSIITAVYLNVMMPPVFGDDGGSAQIICPYDPIYKSKSKYLRKSSTTDRNLLNETVRDEMNRLTMNDDMTASVFTVNITGLTAEDAGKYCCTVKLETDLIYLCTHLIIIMNEEMILNKREGDSMSIECKHHAKYQKVFCKAHKPSMCVNDGVSLQSVRVNETSGVFIVNISDLREKDSGIYWCGSHIVTKVQLNVRKDLFYIILISVCVLLLTKTIMLLVILWCIIKMMIVPLSHRNTHREGERERE